jgi:hypothetical protein
MKVYRVLPDVNKFQYFMLEDQTLELSDMMTFDGASGKADTWIAPSVCVFKPKHKPGNFLALWGTEAIIVDETATEELRDLLEMSGELLPMPYKDKLYHVLNVTACVNVLDHHKTEWLYEKGRLPIKTYAFHKCRFTEAPLFKIPETCKTEILTLEGLKDADDEFKGRVERLGLKGLIFEEVWTDQT